MIVGESITALLFPFSWPHVYAPILPAALHHFLDAPVPFVMGLHAESESNLKIGSEATLCYVDIDKKTIQLPEELPSFPYRTDFIVELTAALDKYNVLRDKSLQDPPTIISPKSFLHRPEIDVMSSSCTLPASGLNNARRKHSLHDVLDWDRPNSPDLHGTSNPPRSEALQRIVDIVRRTGVALDDVDCSRDVMPNSRKIPLTVHEQYLEDLRLNNSIREIFLNRFVQMFAAYENFVILPNQDKDDWFTNRESLQNFDKASFLSEQQQHHRPFLSRFLESQMFATLIDNKILSYWNGSGNGSGNGGGGGSSSTSGNNGIDIDPNLKLFDSRIKILRYLCNYFF